MMPPRWPLQECRSASRAALHGAGDVLQRMDLRFVHSDLGLLRAQLRLLHAQLRLLRPDQPLQQRTIQRGRRFGARVRGGRDHGTENKRERQAENGPGWVITRSYRRSRRSSTPPRTAAATHGHRVEPAGSGLQASGFGSPHSMGEHAAPGLRAAQRPASSLARSPEPASATARRGDASSRKRRGRRPPEHAAYGGVIGAPTACRKPPARGTKWVKVPHPHTQEQHAAKTPERLGPPILLGAAALASSLSPPPRTAGRGASRLGARSDMDMHERALSLGQHQHRTRAGMARRPGGRQSRLGYTTSERSTCPLPAPTA